MIIEHNLLQKPADISAPQTVDHYQKNYYYCIIPLLVSAGRVCRLGDKGRFAKAVTVQCTSKNCIFTSDRENPDLTEVEHRPQHSERCEPNVLTPRPPAPPLWNTEVTKSAHGLTLVLTLQKLL
ncbi:hypothetical protein BsWGS_28199 [Bradybaena similaris]